MLDAARRGEELTGPERESLPGAAEGVADEAVTTDTDLPPDAPRETVLGVSQYQLTKPTRRLG